ncbi:MAG: endonuclease III domain-containing protein [Actinomycetota bacterium]
MSPDVSPRRIRAVHNRLRKVQGAFVPKQGRPIIDELVLTVLSQHTSDINSGRAYEGLRARFADWDEVVGAPSDELEDAIRPGGIAAVKARRIQTILGEIEAREGAIDLERLRDLTDDEVEDYLCSLPGVGPKTAACVLVFSMGRPAFPIDTHVYRIARRLGWLQPKANAEAAHRTLTPRIPPDIRYSLHVAFIEHGRKICKARMPRCTDCVLLDLCAAGPGLLAAGDAV